MGRGDKIKGLNMETKLARVLGRLKEVSQSHSLTSHISECADAAATFAFARFESRPAIAPRQILHLA